MESKELEFVRKLTHTREDFDRLARCYNSFKDPESWPEGFGGTRVFTGDLLEKEMKDQDFASHFIVEAPGNKEKIVGVSFVGKTWNVPNGYYVQFLGVDPEYQRKKLGKALLLRSTDYAVSQKARLITLHTWGGNLKAMPLYKRQGYKWRPDTSVYMENYIPQIITYEFFNQFFSKVTKSWYDCFKPVITQEPNNELDEKMLRYEYSFEDENQSLNVWIDRTIGRINGFHMVTDDENICIKAKTPDSKAYIGFEQFTVILEVQNNSSKEKTIELSINPTSQIQILKDGLPSSFKIGANESYNLEVECRFLPDTKELDMKIHNHTFSDHGLTFDIVMDGFSIPLTVGKVPVKAIKVNPHPLNFLAKSNQSFKFPFNLQNYLEESQEIKVEVEDGNYISFQEHKKTIQLSQYDSIAEFPAKTSSVSTRADSFNITIQSKDGKVLSQDKISFIILNENKAVSYELNEQVFVENKHVRLSFYKKPQPNSNEVSILDKLRGLRVAGLALVLGYPFDHEGSEFYTKEHNHEIVEEDNGLWISSTAVSDQKPKIQVTRKIFIPHDPEPFHVKWEVENLSEETKSNLGIQHHTFWWPGQLPFVARIIPLRDEIITLDLPHLPIDLGKDPSDYMEGWQASVYETGAIGVLFEPNTIEQITIGRFHPQIDFKIPSLAPKGKYVSSTIYYTFSDSWQAVRKVWREIFDSKKPYKLEAAKKAQSLKKVGLIASNGKTVGKGIILDDSEELSVAIDAYKETTFKGNLKITLDELEIEPTDIVLPETKERIFKKPLKFKKTPTERSTSGTIIFDTLTSIYEYPIAISRYNKKEKVSITRNDNQMFYEVDNGFFVFKASEKYRGQIFSLSTDETNLLHTGQVDFPEVKPFLWFSEFYGGIGPVLRPESSWDMLDYNYLKFEPYEYSVGNWVGIGFKSEVIKYSPSIKGLQIATEYLTLPDSPFLLVQAHITNHSEVSRKFFASISGHFKTSNSSKDIYYLANSKSTKGYSKYRLQNWEAPAFLEKDLYTKWSAFQKSGSEWLIAAILPKGYLHEDIYPYAPNMKMMSLNLNADRMEIESKETMTFRLVFLLTKQLETVEPFIDSNLFDLLEEN